METLEPIHKLIVKYNLKDKSVDTKTVTARISKERHEKLKRLCKTNKVKIEQLFDCILREYGI